MPLFLLLAAAAAFDCPANADRSAELVRPAPPKGVAGAIVSINETSVDLRQKDGTLAHVAMTPGWTLSYAKEATAGGVHVGQFIASANLGLAPGRGRATEVRVFEPGYQPEYGTHQVGAPNTPPGTAMTHGFVFGTRDTGGATELSVHYPEGCRVIEVPRDVKVTGFVTLERSRAVPGTAVSAVMRAGEDGVMRAGRLTLDTHP